MRDAHLRRMPKWGNSIWGSLGGAREMITGSAVAGIVLLVLWLLRWPEVLTIR